MGFLMRTHGPEKFQAYQRNLDFARAFGKDLEGLDADWRDFLRTVPLDTQSKVRGATGYDPPSTARATPVRLPQARRRRPQARNRGRNPRQRRTVRRGRPPLPRPAREGRRRQELHDAHPVPLARRTPRRGRRPPRETPGPAGPLRGRPCHVPRPLPRRAHAPARVGHTGPPARHAGGPRGGARRPRRPRNPPRLPARPRPPRRRRGAFLENDYCRRRILLETLRQAHPGNAAVRRLWLLRGFSLDYAGPVEERVARVRARPSPSSPQTPPTAASSRRTCPKPWDASSTTASTPPPARSAPPSSPAPKTPSSAPNSPASPAASTSRSPPRAPPPSPKGDAARPPPR